MEVLPGEREVDRCCDRPGEIPETEAPGECAGDGEGPKAAMEALEFLRAAGEARREGERAAGTSEDDDDNNEAELVRRLA